MEIFKAVDTGLKQYDSINITRLSTHYNIIKSHGKKVRNNILKVITIFHHNTTSQKLKRGYNKNKFPSGSFVSQEKKHIFLL